LKDKIKIENETNIKSQQTDITYLKTTNSILITKLIILNDNFKILVLGILSLNIFRILFNFFSKNMLNNIFYI